MATSRIITEKFDLKLRLTLKVLFIERQDVLDDTLLEKLSSLLEKMLKNEEEKTEIVTCLDSVEWIKALAENWKEMEPPVVAFGLNLIGLLMELKGQIVIKSHSDSIVGLVNDVTANFHNTTAIIRCSMLKLLLKSIENGVELRVVNLNRLVLDCLTDGSIFVSRAARDLAVYLVKTSLTSPNSESMDLPTNLVSYLQPEPGNIVARKKALIALEIFRELCRENGPLFSSKLSSLGENLIRTIQTCDDESICSSSSNVLLFLSDWRFEAGIPFKWTGISEILIRRHLAVSFGRFLVSTCEWLQEKAIDLPFELNALLLSSLIITSGWKGSEFVPNRNFEAVANWIEISQLLTTDASAANSLNHCILTNLSKLHVSFKQLNERFELLDLLLSMLSDKLVKVPFSQKLRIAVLDAVIALMDSWGNSWCVCSDADKYALLCESVIALLEKPESSTVLTDKKLKLAQRFVSSNGRNFTVLSLLEPRLTAILHRYCNDLQWEIRDSAFEMLSKIAEMANEDSTVQNWLIQSKLLRLAVLALEDSESYVRSSCINVLVSVYDPLIKCLESNTDIELPPLNTLIYILLNDSESIARRSAASALSKWFQSPKFRSDFIHQAMVIASSDLDWEVKLQCVEFWSLVLTKALREHLKAEGSESKLLFELKEIGFCNAVVSLANDEDVSVQRKTAELIQKLKSHIKFDHIPIPDVPTGVHCDITGEISCDKVVTTAIAEATSDEQRLLAIEKVLDICDSVAVEKAMITPDAGCLKKLDLRKIIDEHHRSRNSARIGTTEQFVRWISNLDVDSLLEQSSRTTDIYSYNPESLLDDILLRNYESDNEEDYAMDCY